MDRIQVVSKRAGAQDSSLTSHQFNNLAPKIQDQKYKVIHYYMSFSSVIQWSLKYSWELN